jgi:hypothetical protein
VAAHRLETEAVLLSPGIDTLPQLHLIVKPTLKAKLKRLAQEKRRTLSAYVEKLLEDHVRSASQAERQNRAKQRRAVL